MIWLSGVGKHLPTHTGNPESKPPSRPQHRVPRAISFIFFFFFFQPGFSCTEISSSWVLKIFSWQSVLGLKGWHKEGGKGSGASGKSSFPELFPSSWDWREKPWERGWGQVTERHCIALFTFLTFSFSAPLSSRTSICSANWWCSSFLVSCSPRLFLQCLIILKTDWREGLLLFGSAWISAATIISLVFWPKNCKRKDVIG